MPDRIPPDRVGGERHLLDQFLDFHRGTLLRKCQGLSDEQLAVRSVTPSTLTLLGLVRHMAGVERWWFRQQFLGEDIRALYFTGRQPDLDFDGGSPESAKDDMRTYVAEVDAARAAVVGRALDDVVSGPGGQPISLRWVYLHMIAEYARHNGHADLLREAVDGTTGY